MQDPFRAHADEAARHEFLARGSWDSPISGPHGEVMQCRRSLQVPRLVMDFPQNVEEFVFADGNGVPRVLRMKHVGHRPVLSAKLLRASEQDLPVPLALKILDLVAFAAAKTVIAADVAVVLPALRIPQLG
jgi:hypothetical protein